MKHKLEQQQIERIKMKCESMWGYLFAPGVRIKTTTIGDIAKDVLPWSNIWLWWYMIHNSPKNSSKSIFQQNSYQNSVDSNQIDKKKQTSQVTWLVSIGRHGSLKIRGWRKMLLLTGIVSWSWTFEGLEFWHMILLGTFTYPTYGRGKSSGPSYL